MSLLLKIYNTERLLIKNGILTVSRYYAQRKRRDNKNFEEWGPHSELLGPKLNRFHLPGQLGPAWQGETSIYDGNIKLKELVDFKSKESNKLHFSVRKCPMLLRDDLDQFFFLSKIMKEVGSAVITLHYPKHTDVEHSAKNFVIAAREMCLRLNMEGYWADFINPFNSLPFFGTKPDKCFTNDEGFRVLGTKFESKNNCLVIKSDMNGTFAGSIYTNGPDDSSRMRLIFFEHE